MTTFIDRLLGRKSEPEIVQLPKPPHDFCTYCGEPMVNGFLVQREGFNAETGDPVRHVFRRRLCSTQHGKWLDKADELHNGASKPWEPSGNAFGWGSWFRPESTVEIARPCPSEKVAK